MHGWANLAELLHIYSSPSIHQHNNHALLTWVLISFFSPASNPSKELVCNREKKHVEELLMNVLFLKWKENKQRNSDHHIPSPSLSKMSCQPETLPQKPAGSEGWDLLWAGNGRVSVPAGTDGHYRSTRTVEAGTSAKSGTPFPISLAYGTIVPNESIICLMSVFQIFSQWLIKILYFLKRLWGMLSCSVYQKGNYLWTKSIPTAYQSLSYGPSVSLQQEKGTCTHSLCRFCRLFGDQAVDQSTDSVWVCSCE